MTDETPATKVQRIHRGVIDQRQQRIDPTGTRVDTADPDDQGPKRAQKQPGQSLRDPQDEAPDGE